MMKKTVFLLSLLFFIAFPSNARTEQIREGDLVKGTNGKPAGVVYQYDAATGTGYMVSLVDAELPWGEMGMDMEHTHNYINSATAEQDFSGLVNTAAIVSGQGLKTGYAARWCFELNAGGLTGWYLPSCGELNVLLGKKQIVNRALEKARASRIADTWHWSSSEGNGDLSWNIHFSGGDIYPADKNVVKRVRAIRKF
jgi:hypothetical protein